MEEEERLSAGHRRESEAKGVQHATARARLHVCWRKCAKRSGRKRRSRERDEVDTITPLPSLARRAEDYFKALTKVSTCASAHASRSLFLWWSTSFAPAHLARRELPSARDRHAPPEKLSIAKTGRIRASRNCAITRRNIQEALRLSGLLRCHVLNKDAVWNRRPTKTVGFNRRSLGMFSGAHC